MFRPLGLPFMLMTSTKAEMSFNKITRLNDLSDLAELLFPGNRNQQCAFLVVFVTMKWADHRMVPNLEAVAREHGVSRRTAQRVRAKMRRLGLIDRASRFNVNYGGREGWILSGRFERSLRMLAEQTGKLKATACGSQEKDMLMIDFAAAGHREARPGRRHQDETRR